MVCVLLKKIGNYKYLEKLKQLCDHKLTFLADELMRQEKWNRIDFSNFFLIFKNQSNIKLVEKYNILLNGIRI